MIDIFDLQSRDSPLLISVPHAGMYIPDDIAGHMTDKGRSSIDTDWHVDQLYPFASDIGASLIKANTSRYVIDLNRNKEDTELYPGQVKTGLCPLQTFDGEDLYAGEYQPDQNEIARRIGRYWQPYHDAVRVELGRKADAYGYALLCDAHSIRRTVPRLFDGDLQDMNIGTNYGQTCALDMEAQVFAEAENSRFEAVLNGRFVGGHITRHYGQPRNDIHAIQMELCWDLYLDEKTRTLDFSKAGKLIDVLHDMCIRFQESAANHYK